jgi:LysR family transcriptional regulator, hydrogen peroxide-inducible genes activator
MEMHQLRYFVAVARTGTFSRAAGECRVAQPSLSQQIQKLESEVGDRLFERTRRRAILTPAGALFLPHALSILETAERGRQEIREMSGQVRGQVLLAALPTIAPYFLPEIASDSKSMSALVGGLAPRRTHDRGGCGVRPN